MSLWPCSYESTNAFIKYELGKFDKFSTISVFASVNNIFNQKNGVRTTTSDTYGAIYPYNFRRTWFIGMEVEI